MNSIRGKSGTKAQATAPKINFGEKNQRAKSQHISHSDSPIRDMRENLRQSFRQESSYKAQSQLNNVRLPASRTAKPNPANPIFAISFPYAIALIAKTWLGSSTPTSEALNARYGKQPSEEAIYALADELGAEIEVYQNSKEKLRTINMPFIAELNDGQAIVILSQKNNIIKYVGAKGVNEIATNQLFSFISGNFITVYQNLSNKSSNSSSFRSNIPSSSSSSNASHMARLRRLFKFCFKGNKKDLIRMLVAAALSNSLLVTLPLFITIVYDRVVPHGAFETLTALTIGVVLALSIDIGLRATRVNLQESIGVKTALRLQAAVYRKLVSAPLEVGQRATKGFHTMLPELDHAAILTPAIVAGLLADLPFVVIMLGLIYVLTGSVVLVPIIGILLIILTVFTSNIRVSKNAKDVHNARMQVQDQAIETCSTLATTKATRSEHLLLNKWSRITDNSAYLTHKARQTLAVSQQFVLNITQMTIVMTIVAGAVQVNAGAMTLGNLAAATLLVGRVISPISQLIAQLGQFATIQASINSVFTLLDEKEEFGGDEMGSNTKNFKGNISFNKVSFTYDGAQRQSLSEIDLNIKQGEKIGIIGRNGCGKSTLLKMIPRFYLPSSGAIMLDGVDSAQFSPFLLRQSIGYMSQETILMNDSVRANICAGAGDVSEADFERATKLSGVADFIKYHPQGFNLNVGPRGEHLSGGERQAVGLARAILQNPNMIILDEPTSAMDNSAEDKLIQELPDFLADKTIIIATHRMQLLKLVERIIWMDRSRIVADGPKDEVLALLQKKAS